jgi:aryl-alcohol dehydrogenase-like predicted oxidoreductase
MAPTTQLGRAGPRVPAQGFGLMGLSAFAGDNLPDQQRLAVLDRAHTLGDTFWDSSDIYVRPLCLDMLQAA